MRNVWFNYSGKRYRVLIQDDHPAQVYLDNELITTIYPFHAERVEDDMIRKTVREHLVGLQ